MSPYLLLLCCCLLLSSVLASTDLPALVFVQNSRGCTYARPDYSQLTNAQDRQYNNPRCSGETAILTSSSFTNAGDGDWSEVCSTLCQDTSDCRTFQKVFQSTTNYQCRLYRCMPGDNNFFFATGITEERDRAGWFNDTVCYETDTPTLDPTEEPTLPGATSNPTKSPTVPTTSTNSPTTTASPTVTGFPDLLSYSLTNGCNIAYPDYPSMSNAEDSDYSEVRCSGSSAIQTSERIASGDWKDECTVLCQRTSGCKSFSRINVQSGGSFECRLYDCGPDDSNFFFPVNQDANHRSGWLQNGCQLTAAPTSEGQQRPNILFFIADDMSPFSTGYIDPEHPLEGKLPNLERIKQEGTTFLNAYTPYPVCGPTRSAFLTSRHPDTLKIYNFDRYLMQVNKNIQTIPKYFKDEENYYTAGFGKVFHPHALGDTQSGAVLAYELEGHWSQDLRAYHNDGNAECSNSQYYCTSSNGQDLTDYKITTQFINFLGQRQAAPTQPWLAVVGFRRPHTSIAIPAGYHNDIPGDLPIDLETTATDPPTTSLGYYQCDKVGNTKVPINSQWVNWVGGSRNTVRDLAAIQYEDTLRQMRRFYYAAIKWVDEQVGRALDALDSAGMTNNTIILFAGDHGWMIGEKKMFCKNTLFDIGVRVPLYARVPGGLENQVSTAPVSLLDIFPTLIELADTRSFNDSTGLPLEGVSFAPTLQNGREEQYAAYSQYPRCQGLGETQNRDCVRAQSYFSDGTCSGGTNRGRPAITYMGYSLRTKNYRYVEWRPFQEVRSRCGKLTWEGLDSANLGLESARWQIDPEATGTLWEQPPVERELYDYSTEQYFSNFTEGPNLASNTEYGALVADFSEMIRRKFNSTTDPCNNRGHLRLNSEGGATCECIDPWTGTECSTIAGQQPPVVSLPASAPNPTPVNRVSTPIVVTITAATFAVVGSVLGFAYARYFQVPRMIREEFAPIRANTAEERKELMGRSIATLY